MLIICDFFLSFLFRWNIHALRWFLISTYQQPNFRFVTDIVCPFLCYYFQKQLKQYHSACVC